MGAMGSPKDPGPTMLPPSMSLFRARFARGFGGAFSCSWEPSRRSRSWNRPRPQQPAVSDQRRQQRCSGIHGSRPLRAIGGFSGGITAGGRNDLIGAKALSRRRNPGMEGGVVTILHENLGIEEEKKTTGRREERFLTDATSAG